MKIEERELIGTEVFAGFTCAIEVKTYRVDGKEVREAEVVRPERER